ncbi:hypothetical protein Kpol_265p2 [Vanderwaltozyma polyspora DSM 70294]|uniref:Transcription factor n=1 Tax=Vanderwaltozyma polyspora (strain ATCC 22028 / DSM 70294 / BCRC 21397 / CBS 2163 / NBRC 10782 / NRRL Y-8283 / UCD 57-17) TaxID=436907 RepID=A7TT79_VANPO|nr:uncharacterized protein Kpol_265p2 [Vanderwaltozyma polyspora DSM 70294]EDO14527.1 hypothetical protein Kpol_265p2 [Vanderwaltozyma polyspora DSM 70294]
MLGSKANLDTKFSALKTAKTVVTGTTLDSNSHPNSNEIKTDTDNELSMLNSTINSNNSGNTNSNINSNSNNNSNSSNSNSKPQSNEFVRKIYGILERGDYPDIVRWTENGDSFVVLDTGSFTSQILPNHFKHSNFASFVRQLNKYDFHKVKRTQEERKACQYGELSWEFNHPLFKRNQEANLDNIKRKAATQKKVLVDEKSLLLNKADGTQALENESAMNLILNNTVNSESFTQLKKKVEKLHKEIDSYKKENDNYKIELEKLNNKYYTVLESLLTFKTVNDNLIGNFNTLCQILTSQGIDLPQSIQYSSPQKDLKLLTTESSTQSLVNAQDSTSQSTPDNVRNVQAPTNVPIPDVIGGSADINSKNDDIGDVDSNELKKGFHVLLVEDDDVSIQLCSKFLRKYGCTVQVVTDGLAAISILEKFRFDLVLMDIVMPNLDGATATSIIRNFDNRTPIIAMTGSIEHQDLITYLQHGMNDILAKPFTRKDLYSILIRYLKDRVPISDQKNQLQQEQTFDNVRRSPEVHEDSQQQNIPVMMNDGPPLKKTRL